MVHNLNIFVSMTHRALCSTESVIWMPFWKNSFGSYLTQSITTTCSNVASVFDRCRSIPTIPAAHNSTRTCYLSNSCPIFSSSSKDISISDKASPRPTVVPHRHYCVISHRHYSQQLEHIGESTNMKEMQKFRRFKSPEDLDSLAFHKSNLLEDLSHFLGSKRFSSHFSNFSHSVITHGLLTQQKHYGTYAKRHPVINLVRRQYSTNTGPTTGAPGIQKQVSILTAKRTTRKKLVKEKREVDMLNVTAYATAEVYNLEALKSALEGPYTVCNLPIDVEDAIFLHGNSAKENVPSEIFFFREGSVVFWNTQEMERNEILRFLKDHSEDAYDLPSILDELEQMAVTVTQQNTNLIGDVIHLSEVEKESGQSILEKYAFSNAISHSVKLGMWESSLDKFVESIEPVTDDLKDGRRVKMTRTQVLRKLGEVFALRHLINLSSDLLDTPDFYWEREKLEHLYQKTCSQLSISRRIRVMNERLDYCCSVMELLKEHLGDIHHTRLEWMIILLITVEVIFEIQKMIFH